MLYNQIITYICPLIQDVANISIASYSIFNHTFLDWIVQCFAQPCYKMWHKAHSQTSIIMSFHTVYLELAVSNPTSLPTYSRSIEGYRYPRSLNPLSPPDALAYAAPATWAISREGWLGALDFVLWVLALRYAMCQWRSIPWEWWNITWHIQTLSTKDLPTAVVVANTPPRKPDFARLVGTTADMRRLADEAMKVVYIPSESWRSHALLPKNHVQDQFGINLRLTTLNFYKIREKSSGVC